MRSLFATICGAVTATIMSCLPASAGMQDNSIRFAAEQVPESFDAYFNNVQVGSLITHHVWDHLIERDPNSDQYLPSLATSWRWIDATTLEFDLRQGVRFHDGQPFSADDVVYTLNFVADPANRVTSQQNVNWIARAEKLGDHKVRVLLKAPFPAALDFLAGPVVIYPHRYYAAVGPRGMSEKPIGSGPYRVTETQAGRRIRFEINRDYFQASPKPQPTIAQLDLRLIPDPSTQIAELLSGGLDWIYNVSPDQLAGLRRRPELTVVGGETMRVAFLLLNRQDATPTPALRDVRVRRAIAHAIDREAMLRAMVGNDGRVVHSICYPAQFGCTSHVPRYDYDPAKARALLAEAGHANGFESDIYAYRDRIQAEAVQGYLQAVGIRARLNYMQYAALRDALRDGKTSSVAVTWGSFSINDVSAFLPAFFKYTVEDVTRDPELRDLLQTGDTSVDPEVRKQAYARALHRIAEQAYAVPLFALPAYYAFTRDLEFTPHPDQLPRFWTTRWRRR